MSGGAASRAVGKYGVVGEDENVGRVGGDPRVDAGGTAGETGVEGVVDQSVDLRVGDRAPNLGDSRVLLLSVVVG